MNYMKKKWALFLVILLLANTIAMTFSNTPVQAQTGFDIDAESAILIEANTGKILFEKNADLALPPASMSKMMSEYLILEAIHEGKFDWDTKVYASKYANFIKGSTVFLQEGQEVTVKDLFSGLAAFSGNDATVALAEHLAGSEASFVEMMNTKAKEFGMKNTIFVNSTGLPNSMLGEYMAAGSPEDQNLMSARDTAILARKLVTDYPEVLNYASLLEVPEVFSQYQLYNFNWMLMGHPLGQAKPHAYPGVDGLKTGTTDLAKYCFTATAERDGMRLISVVMRAESEDIRFKETRKLLDYAYNNFTYKELVSADSVVEGIEELPVYRGKEKEVAVVTGEPLYTVIRNDEETLYSLEYVSNSEYVNEEGKLLTPLAAGEVVGHVRLVYSGEDKYDYIQPELADSERVTLVAKEDVEKAGWFRLFMRTILDFFAGIWTSITEGIKGWFS